MTEPTPPPANPPRARAERSPQVPELALGIVIIVVGAWLFADVTLGLDVPRVRWGDLWPLALIAIGGWVLLGAFRRR